MGFSETYTAKLVTADEAVKIVKSGDTVHMGLFCGVVYDLDQALAKRVDELNDVTILTTLNPNAEAPAVVTADPTTKHFRYHTTQFSAMERQLNKEGKAWYVPVQFREIPKYWQQEVDIDVAMLQVTPMDKHGYFNLGPQVADEPAVLKKAKTVIVEVNAKMPLTNGTYGHTLHISDVDWIVQGSNRELPTLSAKGATDADKKIAGHIVSRIRNGSTLQLGIGGIPNFVGSMIADSDIKDLSVHSEMFVDAFLKLYQAGKITGNKKLDPGKMVWTFAMGSKELYEFVDGNSIHLCCPVEYVNDIQTIATLDNMVSINSCLELDLFGQVNSESDGFQHIGGNGGQLDFVLGAYASKGGQSFLCTPSVRTGKNGVKTSQIKAVLSAGSIITVPRQVVHNVVTEYGIANLKGKSTWQRAEALISIAHPDFQEELIQGAEKMGIWKNSSKIQ
ncbi:MAG: butyryl-CoA:acetate CoA-transferase [Firmicutes bacterium]|nr:butyryl-CoA:acetate CoA-transferase [Bacillota bacterium]